MNNMIGDSLTMREVRHQIAGIAKCPWPVLILGETGVGKEIAARAVHNAGPRKEGPFVSVNCGGMPESLIESELFGYMKGAFTGADEDRPGKFEMAHGGTVFLDEIGNSPMKLQSSLLRVLETRKVSRIGAKYERDIDVRVICATNRCFEELKNTDLMRNDLFNRISAMIITIPPLRERQEDIPALAEYFIRIFDKEIRGFNKQIPDHEPNLSVSGDALKMLRHETFQGNIRELKNIIQRAVMISCKLKGQITGRDIERAIHIGNWGCDCSKSDKPPLRRLLEENPLEYFIRTYARTIVTPGDLSCCFK